MTSATWYTPSPPPEAAGLSAALGLHPLAAAVLVRRGFAEPEAALAFLDPAHYTPALPAELPGMNAAVERLAGAIRRGEHILVWGDFDVDGQTATALLVGVLSELGGVTSYHIPIRAQESHGVSLPVLQRIVETGEGAHPAIPDSPPASTVRIVLTCDTGIAAFESAAYLAAAGLDLIITDHHELAVSGQGIADSGQRSAISSQQAARGDMMLPTALSIVTPRLLPENHPLATLPGVGVAYKLAEALCQEFAHPELAEAQLDLAALGIVADVARQTGDTRYLLQRGLAALRQTPRVGLDAVYERAGLQPAGLTEEHIAFVLAPRLNALGRLDDANPAVELLTTQDKGRARLLALQLEGLNSRRQLLTSQVLSAARAQIAHDPSLAQGSALVLSHPAWEPGVIGIVASRLVELYGKPVVLISAPPDGLGRASARSTPGVHITRAIASQSALLAGFGGHAMAAGFAIPPENIPAFRNGLQTQVAAQQAAASGEPPEGAARPLPGAPAALQVDGFIGWNEIDLSLAEEIERLAPFGEGNPSLMLACRELRLASHARLGREGDHLLLTVEDGQGTAQRVVWWGGGEFAESSELPAGLIDLAFTLRSSNFGGQRQAQLEYVAFRPAASAVEAAPAAALEVVDHRQEAHPLIALQKILALPASPGKDALPSPDSRLQPDAAAIDSLAKASNSVKGGRAKNLPGGGEVAAQTPADWLILAEGDAPQRLAETLGAGLPLAARGELRPCHTLVVWSTPASPADLKAALAQAAPRRLVLFAVNPPFDDPQAFLSRLAGLVKRALSKEAGRLDLLRLAAASGQRETTVRKGLEWLAASGHIRLQPASNGDTGWLQASSGDPTSADSSRADILLAQLRDLLDETRAYRAHFRKAGDLLN